MKLMTRRVVLAIGAAMLVGGWGTMRYTQAHKRAFTLTESRRTYACGIVGMAIGAGMIGFAACKNRTT